MPEEAGNYVDVKLNRGGVLRVEPLTGHAFRIRLSEGGAFEEPALVRYGVIRKDWPPMAFRVAESAEGTTVGTDWASVSVSRADGRLTFRDGEGKVLLQESSAPACDDRVGFRAEFGLREGERLYGLGDETRDRIQKRGHLARIWVRNVASYAPIPVLLSSGGWGVFVNTTWRHYFDLGHSRPDRMSFGGRRGGLDYYLLSGEDLPTLLDRYTDIAGKPHLLPLWGYGLTFVCNQQASAREMLDDCLNFRREEIPCDLVGLEPGWMEKRYDYSTQKQWHPERFYIPPWGPSGPHTFLAAAERLGFKISLWFCCDYDLGLEEERRAGRPPEASEAPAGFHPDDFEKDERAGHGPIRMDKVTVPEEPWFDHIKKFVDQGVSAFKMDGALQVNEHPDRKWGNGMDDAEMHNLYPTLLNKQMSLGYREQTGRRAMVYSSGGYAGIQQYAATWAGDTGGGPRPLVSILNHGMSGHVNASSDMEVFTPAGIHFGFFQPWSQVCSWAYWRHPWLLGEQLGGVFKHYARLRYRLLPYIYSAAHQASRTGMPIVRAMPLAFPDQPGADEMLQQYMFGEWFLAGAFTNTVHLPVGRWVDYWTGDVHKGEQEVTCTIPEDRGGPLFVMAGAIIPEWPEMQYVGQRPVDGMGLDVYPYGDSAFTMYEDDGVSYAYLDGAVATTDFRCSAREEEVTLDIGAREGAYDGMPASRYFAARLHVDTAPAAVELNGVGLVEGPDGWHYDPERQTLQVQVVEAASRRQSAVLRATWT